MVLGDLKSLHGLEIVRKPVSFEDCVANLRMGDCEYCSFRPRRGVSWRKCALRVKMFLHEGGNIL
jgi:hypothetical protein